MPEPFSAENLNQLRQRWERDPKSRAFLQLAEEYRRAGRLPDAVHVLGAGLKEHPTYLAAQVALGRCLLESGDPDGAVQILELAVARDPTQLVANKLLVEAYLAKGQAAKARERLELYKLFNDRDAEIEPLEARIRALEGPAPAPKRSLAAQPVTAAALFELPAVPELPEVDLEPALAGRRFAGAASQREPFGRLVPADAAQRIEAAFARQGIFPLAPPVPIASPVSVSALVSTPPTPIFELAPPPVAAAPPKPPAVEVPAQSAAPEPVREALPKAPAAPAAPRDWESASWPDGAMAVEAAEPAVAEFAAAGPAVEPAAATVAPAEWALEAPVSEVLPVSAAPKAASATLGELYLAQGHLDEAEESFQSVLQSRPGDAAALAGLESVRLQRGDEAAFADEFPPAEESNAIVGGLTARKAALLKDYLVRIRRGARRRVS